jgi:DNA repair protein RecO (recombination protein O)
MIPKYSKKASAIVLRSIDYGESDRIITFYTDNFGKLTGIAKGARRSKKRFPNALELFSCSDILFSKRNRGGLRLIESCHVTNHYSGIRSDLEKTLVASYFIDLTAQFTSEDKKNQRLFQLLQNFLGIIDTRDCSDVITRLFELHLLKLKGFEPVLDRCTTCKTPVNEIENAYRTRPLLFSLNRGGIKCPKCNSDNKPSIPISIGTIMTLLMGKEMDISKIHRLTLSSQAAEESKKVLVSFIKHLLGKDLKSLDVINKIKVMSL